LAGPFYARTPACLTWLDYDSGAGGASAIPDVYWNHAFERAQIGGFSRAGIGYGGDVAEPTLWRDRRSWGVHHVRFRSAFCGPVKPRRSAINQATYFEPVFENEPLRPLDS
jgi:hypothetical protein